MGKVEEDIRRAITVIDTNRSFVDRFEKIYPFATENVSGCFNNYNFKDKDCLTVLGSSSQMLYMYLNGAENVTTFDVNPLAVYYFYFIKAFLLSKLKKEELAAIFINGNPKITRKIIYKILKNLKGDAYKFWVTLYRKYKEKLFTDFRLFHYVDVPTIYHTSGYLDQESLIELRKIISSIEPNFINCNVKDLPNLLKQQYDLIYLSNIIEYVDELSLYGPFKGKLYSLLEYRKLLMNLSQGFLKDYGLLYAGYIYEPNTYRISEPLYNEERSRVFNQKEFDYHYFKGYNDVEYEVKTGLKSNKKDACIIYQKKPQ